MTELKRVDIVSAAKVTAVLAAIFGLIVGILFTFVGGFGAMPSLGGWWPLNLIFWPILYALAGVVFGALYAALYNVVARLVGGIKIELV